MLNSSSRTPVLTTDRIHSLDALRGLAIAGMILSGLLPKGLPAWMYHIQYWQDGKLMTPSGLSWVDLVFPFFLFSMGTAIPLANIRRLAKGASRLNLSWHAIWRGFLLVCFAYYVENMNPWKMVVTSPTLLWLKMLIGFICLLLLLMRWPGYFPQQIWVQYVARIAGLLGIVLLLSTIKHTDGTGFSLGTNYKDWIILILAVTYTAGALIWLVTFQRHLLRLSIMAIIFALRIHTVHNGWLVPILDRLQIPYVGGFDLLHYLLIVLPGTFIGDWLIEWRSKLRDTDLQLKLPSGIILGNIVIMLIIVILGTAFIYLHWNLEGLVITVSGCLIVLWLLSRSKTEVAHLLRNCLSLAAVWLIIGYILEPMEGGVRKDPNTPSYMFITAGMAIFTLISLFLVMEVLQLSRWFGFLTAVGSNPLLAYRIMPFFVFPVLKLTHLIKPLEWLQAQPGLVYSTSVAVIETFIACLTVYVFCRLKIFLRI